MDFASWMGGYYRDGAVTAPVTLPITINGLGPRFFKLIDTTPADVTVNLPDARKLPRGGPLYYISNDSVTQDMIFKDFDGTTVKTLQQLKAVVVLLVENDTAAGMWAFFQTGAA